MLNLTDYQITAEIYISPKRIVYRGIRISDQQPVILKCFGTIHPNLTEIARLKHEYEITKNLSLSGIIKPLALLTDSQNPVLIFEDIGGISLKKYLNYHTLEIGKFLKIATELAQTLGELHQCGIVHKDVKPSNIIFNPDTFEVKLTDFAIASQLTRENPSITHPDLLEGSLAYMSPEQTGRMNRAIDYRTDFYSLGVTFYEMLTGQLLSESNDLMELVYCHIAKIPVPPNQINSQIPQVVSDLIMKLLAKTAEDRYQSGFGLKIDLEKCLNQWQEKGEILEFSLASQDFSGQLQIPEKLYGRERELAQLLEAFERICTGKSEMILVTGHSGIGKSALVQEIQRPLVRQRGYFIKGKFDQFQRNIPFSALLQAFRDLIGQLLSESDRKLEQWKSKILAALGENGQVIIDVIPELERIIDRQPAVPELFGEASQNRFNSLLKKFIQVFTIQEHPLAIFIDDLQWADSASLKLIQLLITDTDSQYLLMMGAYRDNETSPTHPLIVTLDEITNSGAIVNNIVLQPLALNKVNQLVIDTLGNSERTNLLAELLFNKTQGNPFFLTQLLQTLYAEKLLQFDFTEGRWLWDLEQIQAIGITDYNVVELIARNIQKLSNDRQKVIKLAACIGNQFNLKVLAIVNEKSLLTTADTLWDALQAGLILPLSNAYKISLFFDDKQENLHLNEYKVSYKFLHDRVQQAAYSLIPEEQKKATHLKIGQLLLQKTAKYALEEYIFDIVNQLNIGRELITEPSENYELAKLNLIAGKKAKIATAYEAAVKYFRVALELLAENDWQTDYDLILELYIEAAEAEYLNINFNQATVLTEIAQRKAKTLLEQVKVYELQMQICIAKLEMLKAIDIGLQVLNKLGVPLFTIKGEESFNFELPQLEELDNLPEMTDIHQLSAMRILKILCAPAFQAKPEIFPQLILTMINLCIEYGNSPLSAFAYGFYGLLMSGTEKLDAGYQAGLIAIKILEKFNAKELKAKVYNLFNSNIRSWKEHARNSVSLLQEGVQSGLETGDIEWGGYCAANFCAYTYFTEENLELAVQKQATYLDLAIKIKQEIPIHFSAVWRQLGLNLQGLNDDNCFLVGESFDESEMLPRLIAAKTGTVLFVFYVAKTILCYQFKKYEQALEHAALASEQAGSAFGFMQVAILNFYHSLALLSNYQQVSALEQKEYLKVVKKNQEQMKYWATHAPMNYQHRYMLVEAEKARVLGEVLAAMELYDAAIQGATTQRYKQEEAIANELAAEFYFALARERIAKTYMNKAYHCYECWGAIAKVKDLESRYPDLIPRELETNSSHNRTRANSTISSSSSQTNLLDLTTVLKASQAIASEIDLDDLLAKLMKIVLENAGAQSGILLLNRENQLFIEAAGTIEPDRILVRQSVPVEENSLPLSIINYVVRTQENVVLTDASEQGNFLNDPYIIANHTKSVLCTPITSQGKLIGILYLENNLIAGTFTQERTQLLKLLCSQAAISLENARLYEAQKEYTKTLERQVQERTQELQQQKALFDAFFSAANAGFVIFDRDLRFVRVNDAIAEFNGVPAAEHIGKKLREVLPHLAPLVEPTYHEILATGEPVLNVEVTGETASQPGVERHWLASYFPLPGLDGKPMGAGTVVVEITDRKRAEAQLKEISERLSLALKSGGIGCWEWDIVQNTLIWDDRMYELYGINKNSDTRLVYDIWLTGVHPDDREASETLVHQAALGKAEFDIEFRVVHPNSTIRFIKAFGLVKRDAQGNAQKMIGINFDISDRKQAEEALRQSEERWQLAIKGNKDGIWDFNPKTKELFMSPRCMEILGFEGQERAYYLDDWLQRIHPDDLSTVWDAVRNNMDGKTPYYTAEYRVQCEDGSYKWIQGRGQTVRDEQDNPLRMTGSITDISDRKRAEEALKESERVFRAIFNGAMDAMTITNDRAEYVDANPAACQLFGLSKEQLLKTKISDFNDPAIDFAPIWQHFLEQGQFADEFRLHLFDGTVRDVEFSASANFIPHHHLSVLRDVTDRKQAEVALQKALTAADAASRAKTEFLSKMSHELRTPLNAILGFTQLLTRSQTLTPKQQEYLGIINRAGEHLLTLINDVLEMSKIEAGKVELQENSFDLYQLLDSLEEMFKLKAESIGIQLIFERILPLPRAIKTDESKLRQVLINLLGNAIKFTEQGSVTLRLRATENINYPTPTTFDKPVLYFEVEDTGLGIASEELTTLFDPFVQTETGKKSHSGTGLGLPISREFVQLMGGDITLNSTVAQGTTFQFYIQFKPAPDDEIPPAKSTRKVIGLEPNQPSYRILVVDDIAESRLLLFNLLSPLGLKVRQAANGEEAVKIWQEWQPHLIWMDMQMPIVDGYEATKQIKSQMISTTIIIGLTASAFDENRTEVLAAGCDDFVSKPFREEVIFDKMANYLGIRYIYENPDPKQSAIANLPKPSIVYELTSADLAVMPKEWLAQLHQAASSLDEELIRKLSEQIPETHTNLAQTLDDLARKLRFDKIVNLIQNIPQK